MVFIPSKDILQKRILEERERFMAESRTISSPPLKTEPTEEIIPTVEPFAKVPEPQEIVPQFQPLTPFESRKTEFETPISKFSPQLSNVTIRKEEVPEIPTEDGVEWWEQPKVFADNAMEKVGEGISKIPILPKFLEFIAPAFEFIHEQLEKPWGAIITSPWSPTLPWKRGESWLDHEKREYETWNAPIYVKGAVEFSMPMWWMPWFYWTAKGAKALGVGGKMARATASIAKKTGSKIVLPSKQIFNETLYKTDFLKRMALWAEDKPILHNVVQAVGGKAAFVRDIGEVFPAMDIATRKLVVVNRANVRVPVTDVVKRELVNRSVLNDMSNGYKGLQLPRIQKFGDIFKILQIDDQGRVLSATPKAGNKLGRGLSDVFENPELYTYASKEAKTAVKEGYNILLEMMETAAGEGVKVSRTATGAIRVVFHRLVEGKMVAGKFEKSEFGSLFEKSRKHLTWEDGLNDPTGALKYGNDPIKSIGSTIDHYFKKISQKRFDDEVRKLGQTIPEMVSLIEPTLLENIFKFGTAAGSASHALQSLKRLVSFSGKRIPPATMNKIRRGLPEIANRLDDMFAILPQEVDGVISGLSKEFWKATKLKPREFKVLFASAEGRTFIQKMENTILNQNIQNNLSRKTLERIYRSAYNLNKDRVDDTLRVIRKDVETALSNAKTELKPLKAQYRELAKPLQEGGQIWGNLANFKKHPAFRNMIFDRDVVKITEKALKNESLKWLQNMATVSGTGRMLIAAMDFSAPFIQGLAVLGRNPVAWAKGVGRQFDFFMNPTNLYKYLDDPLVKAVAQERWFYGGARSTFEYFEALAPLQRAFSKVPIVGKYGQKFLGQTYGRAEAAFTGFGEVARNEMWKALRRPGMGSVELRELSRTIDRMTGVMSTEALRVGRTQQDFENAFVFFAPRYTRAGLTYVADVLKGGVSGAQARKSLGALSASGMAMYYGITTVLGQQPNLDPSSARFLTVKIGDDFIGIGGVLYSLVRFGMNVGATAIEDPAALSPLNFSRFDNPFYKFMFSRTAPLTGLAMGAVVEQKNYFGEPLESIGDWGRFLAEKVLPIAMQRAILEPEHRNPIVFASELMGGRTFPKSPWALQEDAQEDVAQREFNQSYDTLDLLKKRQVDRDPEVSKYQEEIDKSTTIRGKALSVAFLERRRDMEDARFMHQNAVGSLQNAYDAGVISGFDFRELVSDAGTGLGATYEHVNGLDRYKGVMEKLKEPKDVSREYRWELAYDELIEGTYSGRFEDEFGIFNYDTYNDFINDLKLKYGEEDFNKAKALQADKYRDYPPLFRELQRAKEVLKPYWGVQDEVERLFGKAYAESTRGKSFISKQRKIKRLSNPEMNRMYELFYAR